MKKVICLLAALALLCACGGAKPFEPDTVQARTSVLSYLTEHVGTDASITGFELLEVSASGETATVTCSAAFTGIPEDTSGTFILTYGKEGGKWVLLSCKRLMENPVLPEIAVPTAPTADASGMQIPEDALRYGGHSYYVFDDNTIRTWEDAQAFCESLGGYLAVIASDEENTALYQYVKSRGYAQVFFGLSDAGHEGLWKWVEQEPSSYWNWHVGQPNGGEKDNYVQFVDDYVDGSNSHTGEWSDSIYGASHIYVFLCEWAAE